MNQTPYILDFKEEDKPIALKELVSKYISYWPWFVASCALFLAIGFFYEQYAPKTYTSEAKIKILDSSHETKVIPNDAVAVSQNLKLNLENHLEVLKSNRLLSQVVRELSLDIAYFEYKDFSYQQIAKAPFVLLKNIGEDDIEKPMPFEILMGTAGYHITDKSGRKFIVPYEVSGASLKNILPFGISLDENTDVSSLIDRKYKVMLKSEKYASMELSEKLNISTSEKQSDVLTLTLKGQSRPLSESILNAVVRSFENDAVEDKRLVARRTLEIIDERFNTLSEELDSIEAVKKDFKIVEDLTYIQTDASVNLQRKSVTDGELLRLETQISLMNLLNTTVANEADYNLLPADIGLSNNALNTMVEKYNEMARERQKLAVSVKEDHPSVKNLSERLEFGKKNILETVKVYKSQLAISKRQLDQEKNKTDLSYSELPEKERVLRSIERQQSIKENLYLLLLKRGRKLLWIMNLRHLQ